MGHCLILLPSVFSVLDGCFHSFAERVSRKVLPESAEHQCKVGAWLCARHSANSGAPRFLAQAGVSRGQHFLSAEVKPHGGREQRAEQTLARCRDGGCMACVPRGPRGLAGRPTPHTVPLDGR